MRGEWRSPCATSECIEYRELGLGQWQVRVKTEPGEKMLLTTAEIGQLAQAYLDGEFGPVKVSRL